MAYLARLVFSLCNLLEAVVEELRSQRKILERLELAVQATEHGDDENRRKAALKRIRAYCGENGCNSDEELHQWAVSMCIKHLPKPEDIEKCLKELHNVMLPEIEIWEKLYEIFTLYSQERGEIDPSKRIVILDNAAQRSEEYRTREMRH